MALHGAGTSASGARWERAGGRAVDQCDAGASHLVRGQRVDRLRDLFSQPRRTDDPLVHGGRADYARSRRTGIALFFFGSSFICGRTQRSAGNGGHARADRWCRGRCAGQCDLTPRCDAGRSETNDESRAVPDASMQIASPIAQRHLGLARRRASPVARIDPGHDHMAMNGVSPCLVQLRARDLRHMVCFVHAVGRLAETCAYRRAVDAEGLPAVAQYEPGYHSVMMAYDFHVTPEGPRLIEVNTNAGGSYLALLAQFGGDAADSDLRVRRAAARAMATFAQAFGDFTGDPSRAPDFAVVVDGRAPDGFSDPEPHAFVAAMRAHWGCEVGLAEPGEIEFADGALRLGGARVDFVYNRFCDFYMETPEMAALRQAYLG